MSMIIEDHEGFAWGTWMAIVLLLAAVSGGSWWLISRRQAAIAHTPPAADSTRPTAAQPAESARPPVESLPFAVQVASLPGLAEAFALADTIVAHNLPAIIAPVSLRGRSPVYRVNAGPFASRVRAESTLSELRASHLVGLAAGSVVDVPLSLDLGTAGTRGAALAEKGRLRAAGVPVFILGQADGAFRLYAGAYDARASAQVSLLQDLLTPTSGAGVLGPRTGYVP